MAIKFAPKEPTKETPAAAAPRKAAATPAIEPAVPVEGASEAGAPAGDDLFGGKPAAGKRRKK